MLEYGKPLPPELRSPDGDVPVYGANGIKDWTDAAFRAEPTIIVGRKGSAGEIQLTDGPFWPLDVTYFVDFDRGRHDLKFLYYLLDWIDLRKLAKGVKPGINRNDAYDIPVSVPPLEEQRRIVAVLDEAFAAIATATANAEKNLANARDLFELERDILVSGGGPDWIEGPLGEVCNTQYGISGSMNAEGEGYKIFRMGEVQDGQMVDTGTMKYIDISEPEFEPYRLRKGDVLFNRTNSIALVGKTGIFSLDGLYCFASYLIRVNFDPARMLSRFACHMMNSRSFLDRVRSKAAQSVNQANINATILRNERVFYPRSLAAQEALADKLDQLRQQSDNLSEAYEAKLAHLAALKQSLLHRAFSGELTTREPLAA